VRKAFVAFLSLFLLIGTVSAADYPVDVPGDGSWSDYLSIPDDSLITVSDSKIEFGKSDSEDAPIVYLKEDKIEEDFRVDSVQIETEGDQYSSDGLQLFDGYGNEIRSYDMDSSQVTVDFSGIEADKVGFKAYPSGTGGTIPVYSFSITDGHTEENNIGEVSYSSAVSWADDYFERPESLSCAVSYAPLFGDCWVDFGLFTFGDDSKQIFLEDLKANGAIMEEDRNDVLNSLDLLNNQSFGIAQAGAKITATELLNNGTEKVTAQSEIREDVKDFWAERQKNLVSQHQLEIQQFNQTLVTGDSVGATRKEMFNPNYTGMTIYPEDYTLVNGSDIKTYKVIAYDGSLVHSFDRHASGLETTDGDKLLAGSEYAEKNDALVNLQSNAYQASDELVSNIYGNYSQGEVSVFENVGPLEQTRLLSTNLADSGASSYLAGAYRQMGLASDFNASFEITYSNQDMSGNETVTGNLYVEEHDYGNFTVGENYSAQDKTAYIIYQAENGEPTSKDLDGSFRVEKIFDTRDGSELNSTQVQTSDFYSPDIEELQSQLREYQESIEELEGTAGGAVGGATGLFGLSPSQATVAGAVGGISLILLLVIAL